MHNHASLDATGFSRGDFSRRLLLIDRSSISCAAAESFASVTVYHRFPFSRSRYRLAGNRLGTFYSVFQRI